MNRWIELIVYLLVTGIVTYFLGTGVNAKFGYNNPNQFLTILVVLLTPIAGGFFYGRNADDKFDWWKILLAFIIIGLIGVFLLYNAVNLGLCSPGDWGCLGVGLALSFFVIIPSLFGVVFSIGSLIGDRFG